MASDLDGASHVDPLSNGRYYPKWFRFTRQLVLFCLGISLILYATFHHGPDVPFLITGLILVGIVPIDDALDRWQQRARS